MALYKVDSDTAELTKVSGGTLYADLPIGSWVKNDMDTLPSGFLKEGDTISQSECPELYAKYGSTVPYKADTSELSEYENFSLSTTPATLPYDGFMSVSALTNDGKTLIYLNDQEVARFNVSGSQDPTVSFSFKKGDSIRLENTRSTITNCKVAYYKKSLIVKAKNVGAPADLIDGVKDALCSYSTNETVVGTWIDGKPIYRLVSVANRLLDGNDVQVTGVFSQAIADTVDTLIKFTAVGGRTAYPGQTGSSPMTATFNAWQSTSDNRNIYCNADNKIYSTSVIVEYTKTTD